MDGSVAPGRWVGERLEGRYHLVRLQHEGEQAEVYEAEDERLQRRVTVHVAGGEGEDPLALSGPSRGDVLDAGEHAGRAFVVLPLSEETVVVGVGGGDDAPTGELPTVADHTQVLPVPLVPVPEPAAVTTTEPSRAAGAVRSVAGGLWARRILLATVGVFALLLLVGLAARDDSLEVPTDESVPVTAEPTTTTIAPTTTSPPTTEQPAQESPSRGKGKKDKDDD